MQRFSLALFAVVAGASGCKSSRDVPIRAEPEPSASVAEVHEWSLAEFDFRVPKRCTYIQHGASAASSKRIRILTEETVESRSDADGVTVFNTYTERPTPPESESTSARTWRQDARGFVQLSQKALRGADSTEDRDFDPPLVIVPGSWVDGASWETPYPKQRKAIVTLRRGSHYCASGIRTESRVSLPKGISKLRRSHFCPGQGWRGDDSVYSADGRVQGWSWTTDLVADGEGYPDPSLDLRFPEGAPPRDTSIGP